MCIEAFSVTEISKYFHSDSRALDGSNQPTFQEPTPSPSSRLQKRRLKCLTRMSA